MIILPVHARLLWVDRLPITEHCSLGVCAADGILLSGSWKRVRVCMNTPSPLGVCTEHTYMESGNVTMDMPVSS